MDLLDIPKIYTALAEFASCMIYITLLPRKISRQRLLVYSAAALAILAIYHYLSKGIASNLFWVVYMIGAVTIMYVFIYAAADETWQDKLYCTVRAFVLAEFTASTHWQLYHWVYVMKFDSETMLSDLLSHISMIVIYVLIFIGFFMLERKHFPQEGCIGVSNKELLSACMAAVSAFIMSNLSFAFTNTPFSGVSSSILYIRTLADLSGLLILYSQQEHHNEMAALEENIAVSNILDYQYSQYQLAIQNTEQLKREIHDLKHYMIAIRSENDPAQRERYLEALEQAIDIEEAFSNTGNSVLDTILTAKQLTCIQNHITFACMADGNLLDSMNVKDICSVFGNILDNAIEHVSHYSTDKRIINMSITKHNSFIVIECSNYTEENLEQGKNGLPKSTKKEKGIHGYGLKSVRYVVEKYSGNMTINSASNTYTIKILIPV